MKRIFERKYFSSPFFLAALSLCVIMLVVGIIVINERTAARQHEQTDSEWSLIARPISSRDHTIGNLDAPVQVIFYADFQCKYCGDMFHITIPKLQAVYGNKVVIAYRHMPLPIQPQAYIEAEASECVYQQGGNLAFWRFASIVYAIPSFEKGIDLSTLPDIAQKAGVDSDLFRICMQKGDGRPRVETDKIEGSVAGLQLTPSAVLKSAYRAVTVQGNYYSQLSTGINYLLETIAQIESRR